MKNSVKSRKSRSKETATYSTTGRRRCENESSYTAATTEGTRSCTNKKELELEVYSEGFVYK